jgi:site-specific DNA-cytosine methylase
MVFIPVDSHSLKAGLVCLGGLMKPTNKLWLNNGKILQRNFSQGNRVYSSEGKAITLSANGGGIGGKTGLYEIEGVIRKLTRIECERLQTVPEGYTNVISESQAIKALGNGWTVDVIAHIFSFMK